jgi:hypothetical protein
MESRGIFTVGKNALIPGDARARDIMAGVSVGDRVLVKLHRPRYIEHHRLAYAVFQRIADAIGQPVDNVVLALKFHTGHVDLVKLPDGRHIAAPRSLNFASLSQDEFQSWWREALEIIKETILPGLPQREYEEIREIIAGRAEAA